MSAAKCPICGKPTETKHKPFCSQRCAERDLARWLNGAYAIPAVEQPEDEEEAGLPADPDSGNGTFH